MGYIDRILGSWLEPNPALAATGIWQVNLQVEVLSARKETFGTRSSELFSDLVTSNICAYWKKPLIFVNRV